MKKNLKNRSHVLSVTRYLDKSHQLQKFVNLEKHPRQKQADFAETVNANLPIHIVF